jgi:Flp pilus assembly protein TadD
MSLKNGETAEARNLLGVVYLAKGRPEMSLKELDRARAIAPRLPGVPDNMARALILLNRMAEAQEICANEAAHGRPCSEEVLKQLSRSPRDG